MKPIEQVPAGPTSPSIAAEALRDLRSSPETSEGEHHAGGGHEGERR